MGTRTVNLTRLGLLALTCLPAVAEGRWEKVTEADVVHYEEAVVTIDKDATSTMVIDKTVEIKLDEARSTNGTIAFYYNTAAKTLSGLEAETITGDTVEKVSPDHIEDKPESGQDLGFDKVNKVSIAFPHVAIGSRLHFKYALKTNIVPVAGLFDHIATFGAHAPELPPTSITYRSKLPLYIHADDPDHYLGIVHHHEGGFDVVSVKVLRPVYFNVVNESTSGYFLKPPYPTVYVSTFKKWSEIGKVLSSAYEAEMAQAMPPHFSKIADAAKASSPAFVDRANAFTAALADIVRYQGDWRTVRGGHIPRPLAVIAETGFGDCKDMALVTAAALRRMGYKANVALTHRGDSLPDERPLPTMAAFNHAIVRAEDEHGDVHWIDATNRVSRAQGIRVDIAGRPALVIDPVQPALAKTTTLAADDVVINREAELDIHPEQSEVATTLHLHFVGGGAEAVAGWELAKTKAEIDEFFLRDAADSNQVFAHTIAPYDLHSRIVKDTDIDMTLRSKIFLTETTAGHAFSLLTYHLNLAKLDLADRVSGVPLGTPESYKTLQILDHTELVGTAPAPCSLHSKWLIGERRVEASGGKIILTQWFSSLVYGIPPDELKTPEFAQFQAKLRECFGAYSVVFRMTPQAAAGSVTH